jgi:leucyl-tRNA synthetase
MGERKNFEVNENSSKPKYYLLEMFPFLLVRVCNGHSWNNTMEIFS